MNFNQIQVGGPNDMPQRTTTWSNSESNSDIHLGWVCPKCGRVYSPSQSMCLYCGGNMNVMPITVNDDMPSLKDYLVYKVNPLEAPEIHLNPELYINYDKFLYNYNNSKEDKI